MDFNNTGLARTRKPAWGTRLAGLGLRIFLLGFLAMGSSLDAQALGSPTMLEFGEVVVGAGGGTITTDPLTGGIISTSNVFPTSALTTSSSITQATGTSGRAFTIMTTLTGNFTMTGSGGGTFTSSPVPINSENPTNVFTFPSNGIVTFHVAGTLSIPGGLTAGDYNGALPIFIRYNNNPRTSSGTVVIPIHIRLIAPLTLTNNADLDMGIVVPGVTPGTVTINPSTGVQTMTGGVVYASASGTPAQFAVTGAPSHSISITLGAGTVTLIGPAGTMTLTLSSSVASPTTLSAAGAANFGVGGVVGVAANQADGNYVGTLTITVAYP